MDIHNYDKRYQAALRQVQNADIPERNKQLILDFGKDLILEGASKPRLLRYHNVLKIVAQLLGKEFDKAEIADLKGIVATIQQRNDYSPWTKQAYKIIIRRFYKWLAGTKTFPPIVDWITIGVKRSEKPLPSEGDLLSESDIQKILQVANHPKYRVRTGQEVYRPFTFKEGIKARVDDYNTLQNPNGSDRTLDERLHLFTSWNDSCTGAAYKAGTTKFKIIPVCEPLILIERDYNEGFLAVAYTGLTGVELDSKPGILNVRTRKCKYGEHLTKQQIEEHDAWRAAVEGDVALLKEYRDIVFVALQQRNANNQMPEKAMGFYVRPNTDTDELKALLVDNLGNYSDANGNFSLGVSGSFVRRRPVAKNSP